MQYNITYRKKDGGWQYIISYKENGKWKQKSKQGFKTKRAAQKAADKRLEELKEEWKNSLQISKEYEGITFGEFLEMFIEHEKLHKEQNTILGYKSVKKHLSYINDMILTKITSLEVQVCIDEMIKKGLAPITVETYASTIKTIFNSAIKQYKIIEKNPAENLKLPDTSKKEEEEKTKALTSFELKRLLSELKGYISDKEYISVLLAATCGLRVGEILGLTWDDIDFKESTLQVNKQWKRLKKNDGRTIGFGTLKSGNSYRTVPIPPSTLKELKRYKKENPTDINNRIVLYKNIASLSRDLPKKFDMVGFNITMHTLRHTYATTLISNGVDFKTAAKILGHDVEMTMKTYSHVTDEMMNRATKTIKSVFK